jgi:hypothetical protein
VVKVPVRPPNGGSGGTNMTETLAQLSRSGVQILRPDEGVDPLLAADSAHQVRYYLCFCHYVRYDAHNTHIQNPGLGKTQVKNKKNQPDGGFWGFIGFFGFYWVFKILCL